MSFGEVRADDEAEALRQRIAQLRKRVAALEGQVQLGREEREALQRLLAAKAAPDPQAEQELLAKKLQKRDMLVKKLEVSVSGAETEKRKMLEKIKAQNAELARRLTQIERAQELTMADEMEMNLQTEARLVLSLPGWFCRCPPPPILVTCRFFFLKNGSKRPSRTLGTPPEHQF